MSSGEWDFTRTDSYVVNFKGRRVGKCTPTDLDWVLEIRDKVLIFAEVKRIESKGLPLGQKILAENLCRYIPKETIPVFYFYVQGIVKEGQIEIEDGLVLSYYSNINHKWVDTYYDFKDAVDKIIEKYCK